MFGEKETYKYLGILQSNTIKQEKVFKNISEEQKTTRNQTIQQKAHQGDKYLACLPCKILGTFPDVHEGRTKTKRNREQEYL